MRRLICRLSLTAALLGWAISFAAWLHFGVVAAVRPSFLVGLSVGITATLSWVVNIVMPDQAALYALGFRDGAICADCPVNRAEVEVVAQPRRRLTVV